MYASKVGSFAKVVPDRPRSILILAPLAYGLPAKVPDDVVHVTLVSIYG